MYTCKTQHGAAGKAARADGELAQPGRDVKIMSGRRPIVALCDVLINIF